MSDSFGESLVGVGVIAAGAAFVGAVLCSWAGGNLLDWVPCAFRFGLVGLGGGVVGLFVATMFGRNRGILLTLGLLVVGLWFYGTPPIERVLVHGPSTFRDAFMAPQQPDAVLGGLYALPYETTWMDSGWATLVVLAVAAGLAARALFIRDY